MQLFSWRSVLDILLAAKRTAAGTHRVASRLAASAAAALAVTAVPAEPVASASVGPLQFEVADLRPDDGQSAWYRLDRTRRPSRQPLSEGYWATSTVEVREWHHPRDEAHPALQETRFDGAFLVPMSVSLADQRSSAMATLTESGLSVTSRTRSFGSTDALALVRLDHFDYAAPPPGYFGLELAPYAALTLSFEAQLRVADDGMTAGEKEYAWAHVFFDFNPAGDDPAQWSELRLRSHNTGGPDLLEKSATMSFTLTNDSDALMNGHISLSASALTIIGPAPIPEPSSLALALAGGLLLIVLRLKAARSASP
ncbi:hypothetical protein [Caldimonas brevitalea]|uniref:PEP-CTERM protein-sorting domain-containing protein n=1 Tax=Caldimonas brevitalea TaxID=413882 RepID=A0A0G3BZI1_9BURK|nr:hypothetical protein [Caldimonas brevitalea]AKJ31950.1 hypothetical protein AAW51_5259 [Caldimonas brevitalea]